MNKEEALKLIGEKDNDDWQVFTKPEYDTFLTNYKETEVSKEIGSHVSGLHQKYDDTIKDVLGETKPFDVKTHEFLRTKLTSLKEDIQGKETKISDLEKAVGDKTGDEALKLIKSDHKALQEKHQRTLDEFKTQRESQSKEITKVKLKNQADHALMGIKFLSTVPEDARKALIEIAQNEVVNSASFLDSKAVFLDENGDPQRDDQYAIITIESKLKEKLKSIIDEGRKLPGVDVKDPRVDLDDDGKIKDINVNIPESVKTLEALIAHLHESGFPRGTDEYFAALDKYGKKLKLI